MRMVPLVTVIPQWRWRGLPAVLGGSLHHGSRPLYSEGCYRQEPGHSVDQSINQSINQWINAKQTKDMPTFQNEKEGSVWGAESAGRKVSTPQLTRCLGEEVTTAGSGWPGRPCFGTFWDWNIPFGGNKCATVFFDGSVTLKIVLKSGISLIPHGMAEKHLESRRIPPKAGKLACLSISQSITHSVKPLM